MKNLFKRICFILAFLLLIFIIAILPLTGCGDQQVIASTETQSDDTETGQIDKTIAAEAEAVQTIESTSSEFKADGIISAGEYKYSSTFEDFDISWSNDAEFVYIAIKAETEGFVAVAVQPGKTMNSADMILGWVQEGQTVIVDAYSTGNFGPHPPDTELGGTDDIIEYGGMEENGFTVIEFKRALKTGDQYDNELVKGTNQVIWSYSINDDPEIKHKFRGYGEITID